MKRVTWGRISYFGECCCNKCFTCCYRGNPEAARDITEFGETIMMYSEARGGNAKDGAKLAARIIMRLGELAREGVMVEGNEDTQENSEKDAMVEGILWESHCIMEYCPRRSKKIKEEGRLKLESFEGKLHLTFEYCNGKHFEVLLEPKQNCCGVIINPGCVAIGFRYNPSFERVQDVEKLRKLIPDTYPDEKCELYPSEDG